MSLNPLGELFPSHIQDNHRHNHLERGSVLRIFLTETHPPKYKWIVILGLSSTSIKFGFLIMNTEINPSIFNTSELRNEHFQIAPTPLNGLEHKSYVDCTDIYEKNRDELEKTIEDISVIKGKLDTDDLLQIEGKIRNSDLIPLGQKRKYSLAPVP